MTKRKMVAAAVLGASLSLPMAAQELRGDATAIAEAQWAWALGMSRDEAFWFGAGSLVMCNMIPNPGSLACGAAGLA